MTIFRPIFIAIFFFIYGNLLGQSNPSPYITVWNTGNGGETNDDEIWVPAFGDFTYEWEELDNPDNAGSSSSSGSTVITFPESGAYRLWIYPDNSNNNPFHRISFGEEGDHAKLMAVEAWGDIEWSSFESAYLSAFYLNITADDIPNLNNVQNMSMAFAETGITTIPHINSWDVSYVTEMMATFAGTDFNEDISGWDVSNVEMFAFMFAENMTFNQPLNTWDVSSAVDMEGMFYMGYAFNGNISDWDVSNVENMYAMFAYADYFNQDISGWNVGNVEEMGGMFGNAYRFNQDISGWDVSNVRNMYSVFGFANSFNQDISGWDVSNVEDMTEIFFEAESFDQNLGNWNLSSLSDGSVSFKNSAMSCENYSYTLAGWAANENTPSGVLLEALTMKYSPDVSDARELLINTKGWTITGDSEGSCAILGNIEQNSNTISIYPNPTADLIYFEGIKGNEHITVTDMLGRNIKSLNISVNANSIDLSNLERGVYILTITDNSGNNTTKKIIKR